MLSNSYAQDKRYQKSLAGASGTSLNVEQSTNRRHGQGQATRINESDLTGRRVQQWSHYVSCIFSYQCFSAIQYVCTIQSSKWSQCLCLTKG